MKSYSDTEPEPIETVVWHLRINDSDYQVNAYPEETLASVLRNRLRLTGTKLGCNSGRCGTCTVVIGKRAVKSCQVRMRDITDRTVTTIEGLQYPDGTLHPVQSAFLKAGAVQCGFCTPGMIMAVYALLMTNPKPDKHAIRQALKANLCRCTGYQPIEEAVLLVSNVLPICCPEDTITESFQVDGIEKVTGAAMFTDDLTPENTLYGAVAWSSEASGILENINTQDAIRIPGVAKIITAADIPGQNAVGRWRADRPLLVDRHIRFSGDALALVLADTPETARKAALNIHSSITPVPGLFDPRNSLNSNAPAIHRNSNIAAETSICKKGADISDDFECTVYESRFDTPFVEHALLETESAVAQFDNDTLVIVCPSQNVYFDRLEIMRILGLSPRELSRVRVKESFTGAAFGKREDILAAPLAALGTWLTGQPVKLTFNRYESFLATTKRHPMRIRHATYVDTNNRICKQTVDILADTGAYSSWAPNILRKSAVHASGPYSVPNARVNACSVYTNNAFSGAMRGFGAVQTHLAAERHMDLIARKRRIDPVLFRKTNALRPGLTTLTGQTIQYMTDVAKLLDTAAAHLPWKGPARGKQVHSGWATGYGIAASFYGIGYGNGIPDKGQVELVYYPDKTVRLYTSAIDYGQGAKTVFARLVSEILGVPSTSVQVLTGDTALTPDSGSTVASRQTFVTGNAVIKAARKLVHSLKMDSRLSKPLRIKTRYLMESHTIDPVTGQGDVYKTFSASAAAVRVRVSLKTGIVIPEKFVSVHDSGTIIHPVLARSQVTGGVVMGVGMALYEEYRVEKGHVKTMDFSSYKIPGIQHIPDIQVIFLPTVDPDGPSGAKGLGEPATLASAPAVVNAVCDALDMDFTSTPLCPELILKTLNR